MTNDVPPRGLPWSWHPPRWVAPAACAVLAAAVAVAAVAHVAHFDPPGAQPWIDYALALAGSLSLAMLHKRPLAVCAVVIASDLAAWFFRPSWTTIGALVLPVVIYAAASRDGRWVAAIAWLVCLAGLATAVTEVEPPFLTDGTWLVIALLAAVGAIGGDAAYARRRWHTHDREARQRRAALEERLRLSRELHDVVGHHLTAIALQADAAARQLHAACEPARASAPDAAETLPSPAVAPPAARQPRDAPEPARAPVPDAAPPSPAVAPPSGGTAAHRFGLVADTARTALAETRQLIAYLRQGGDRPPAAQPGIEQLPQLVAEAMRDGLIVDLRSTGPAAVPPAVGLVAYRVVQEALTNVRKHSRAPTARVEVGGTPLLLTVRVADPGPAAEPAGRPGFGLTGLRERVTAQGGRLRTRQRDGGGFEVTASLPLAEES